MALLLAIDPGKKTGWAMANDGLFASGEVDGQMEFMRFVESVFLDNTEYREMAVVVENYLITPETVKKSRQNYSLELIGTLRWICDKKDIPFSLQTPREAKAFSTDDKLKTIGWYNRGQGHANDAARHLLLFAVKNGVVDPERFVSADLRL